MPRLDGQVVSASASVICNPCGLKDHDVWSEEPTIVECWPVEHGFVDDDGEYRTYSEEPQQQRRAIDFRFKDTLLEVYAAAGATIVILRGDLGAVRLFLSDTVALEMGLQLKTALLVAFEKEFARWVCWPPPDAPRRPPSWDVFDAHFEGDESGVRISSRTGRSRITLILETEKTAVWLTLEDAVAFKLWRAIHPSSA